MFKSINAMLIVCFAIIITGCSYFSNPRQYDPVEYNLSVATTVNAGRAIYRCNSLDDDFWKYMQLVNTNSLELSEFLSNKQNSDQYIIAVESIRNLVNNVLKRTKFSAQYCVHKLSNIQVTSRILSRSLGRSEKFNQCEITVRDRLVLFDDSLKANRISKSEYQELLIDLDNIAKVNQNSCNVAKQDEIREDIQAIAKALSLLGKL